jgi:hypothetical protein
MCYYEISINIKENLEMNKNQKTIKDAVKLLKNCLSNKHYNLTMDQKEELEHAIFLLEMNIDIFKEDKI